MDTEIAAIERCAYCREYVPVTYVEVRPADDGGQITATVAMCEHCRTEGL